MTATAKSRSRKPWLLGITAFAAAAAFAGIGTLAFVGWALHADEILISALAAGWASCF